MILIRESLATKVTSTSLLPPFSACDKTQGQASPASPSTPIATPCPLPPTSLPPALMALVEKLQEKLLEFRLQALLLAALAALVPSLFLLGPSFRTVVAFFWPLLLSTALFLAAVLVLRVISPPPTGALSDRAGEELMDYVAGCTPEDLPGAEVARGQAAEYEAAAATAAAGQQGSESAAAAEGGKKS